MQRRRIGAPHDVVTFLNIRREQRMPAAYVVDELVNAYAMRIIDQTLIELADQDRLENRQFS